MLNSAVPAAGDAQAVTAANIVFVKEFVANLLKAGFPHFTDNQIKITVQGLFDLNQDLSAFKEHIRDFLVQIKEFTGDDADLYLDDREAALRRAHEEKRKQQAAVPGILNPHEVGEEMQD
ncbi:exportin-1-like [Pollicipes pollicipes]|nr:exportin-1-like [Pollicipes pollicipes]